MPLLKPPIGISPSGDSHSPSKPRVPSRRWWELEGGVISGLFSPIRRWRAGGDHAIETDSTTLSYDTTLFAGEAWFDPIEAGLLGRGRCYERRGEEAAPGTSSRTSAAAIATATARAR
jgi:hypothetical protein